MSMTKFPDYSNPEEVKIYHAWLDRGFELLSEL